MLCFSRLSPEAESVSSRCRSISEWVIAAESPYQPHFLLGSEEREKKNKKHVFCAIVVQQFVFITRFKIR